MHAIIDKGVRAPASINQVDPATVDPLDHDAPGDELVVTSRRGICRVATVAAEAGARFQREGVGIDPMAWMLAPRRMFDGSAPIDACLERTPFLRGVLVHGLALDLDMDREEIDDLLDDEEDTHDLGGSFANGDPDGFRPCIGPDLSMEQQGDVRLFTATVVRRTGSETMHAFHASLAHDETEILERLLRRIGPSAADAVVVDGFDPGLPLVEALVAPAIAETLIQIAAAPGSPLAAGLDLNVEQRFVG